MTKKDIIDAAFRVWGRDLYRKPSLSSLAKELKVSKPALYRHFLNKEAITNAMSKRFYDDFTSFIKPDFEKAAKTEDPDEGFFTILRAIAGFYTQNCYALIFSFVNACEYKLEYKETFTKEFKARGVDTGIIKKIFEKKYDYKPGLLQFIFAALSFYIANFHKDNNSMITPPAEKQINEIISAIHDTVKQGLKFRPEQVNSVNFEKLEKLNESNIQNEKPEPLFKAVAEAVAEAGPWEASMELVAKKMGLSKSSLYGHFKNKKDMLRRLFITEFKRIMDFAKQGIKLSSNSAEQLYLGIYSIAFYLNSRPEILVAIDWIHTRRLDLGKKGTDKNHEFLGFIDDIDIESLRGCSEEKKQLASGLIMFLLAVILPKTKNEDSVPENKEKIRVLYRFITLGLGGFSK